MMREIELHIDGDGLAPRLFVDTDFDSMGVRYLTNSLWPILYRCPSCVKPLDSNYRYNENFCGDCGQQLNWSPQIRMAIEDLYAEMVYRWLGDSKGFKDTDAVIDRIWSQEGWDSYFGRKYTRDEAMLIAPSLMEIEGIGDAT